MEKNYTNIPHFKFKSVSGSTITQLDEELISIQVKEDQFNGVEIVFDKNYFINSLWPFFSELNEKEKDVIKNYLSESWDMLNNIFLYLTIGSITYLSISDSLLKSQQIHCKNGSQVACSYLKN